MSLATFSPSRRTRMPEESPLPHLSSTTSPTVIGQQWLLATTAAEDELLRHHRSRRGTTGTANNDKQHQWIFVLPVLLLEFLAIGMTRAILPSILLQEYGNKVYLVLGSADCIRGLLAFFACPLFGKLSDLWGRKQCLLITVLGSCAPVCSLALFSWRSTTVLVQQHYHHGHGYGGGEEILGVLDYDVDHYPNNNDTSLLYSYYRNGTLDLPEGVITRIHYTMPPSAIPLFVVLLSLSGIFSSTFTLVFAYISDTVETRNERVSAFGLALACFGLSFTIGPMAGGYLAHSHTHYVFTCSLILTILDLIYIQFFLPESLSHTQTLSTSLKALFTTARRSSGDGASTTTTTTTTTWSPMQSVTYLLRDPFLHTVGKVAFYYYTGVWAVISTLSIYAVQRFGLTPERLGELMSALGLCTMMAEAVLVRLIIPWVGEKKAIQIGLISFAMQCLVLGAANQAWHLFVCVGFSLLGNLVYPSLSSLVSGTVDPESNGEALGAINGVKALTEGIGPLIFGGLMTISEGTDLPGWPYWIAAILVLKAYQASKDLPFDGSANDSLASQGGGGGGGEEDGFVYELQFKQRRQEKTQKYNYFANSRNESLTTWLNSPSSEPKPRDGEEYQPLLLSDVEEDDDDCEGDGKESAVRMPYQDTPNAPLAIFSDDGYLLESSGITPPPPPPPSFAIPPSMRRVTDVASNTDAADGIPFSTPTITNSRSFFTSTAKSDPE
ncbi:unnamed protein product [Cylindrotheca closterium]|uniref:Major facilitator superfamily (MFS) profile domain-containing protein n=1 Tax=Cylindrotheca closterium TaxID=2856 RepID=A0AAD2FPF5_9STRA|nr:unnamed protein product [Cylindrotheca closterium]